MLADNNSADAERRLHELLDVADISELESGQALAAIGQLVDLSFDLQRQKGLRHAIKWSQQLDAVELPVDQRALLNYFTGNAWSGIRQISRAGTAKTWDWHQEELEQEIMCFRRAALGGTDASLARPRLCQVYTNLGNTFSHIGRFVEALDYWDKALALEPAFPMAMGNKGYGLFYYGIALYDGGHRQVFLKLAHEHLSRALQGELYADARHGFRDVVDRIESGLEADYLKDPLELPEFELGNGDNEQKYRRWCLANRLFLNPLNDLGPHSIAATDVLTTPSIAVPLGAGPSYPAFFNQMKQEFVSARFLLHEGLHTQEAHFSDKDVLLYNTLDYPVYSLATEKQKLAFRAAYSLLDKVAFFLNEYMELGIRKHQVSFQRLWYDPKGDRGKVRGEFRELQNWPFRGLFWLAKDLYEDREGNSGFRECIEPEGRRLAEVRNQLEHKYLKIHDEMWLDVSDQHSGVTSPFRDALAFSVGRTEFSEFALKMLRLARAALIYLSLGVHVEERRREASRGPEKRVGQMHLDRYEDDWKR
jgi:hypothetical protein